MRRAVLTLGGTAAGLAALLSLKIHPANGTSGTPPATSPAAGGAAARGEAKPPPARTPAARAAGGTTRTVTGKVANTQPDRRVRHPQADQ